MSHPPCDTLRMKDILSSETLADRQWPGPIHGSTPGSPDVTVQRFNHVRFVHLPVAAARWLSVNVTRCNL
jgi:hypothetical protein